jgi:hypothetical protein
MTWRKVLNDLNIIKTEVGIKYNLPPNDVINKMILCDQVIYYKKVQNDFKFKISITIKNL